jgi:ribosomal protein L7/L12/phage FluMu protein Com
MRVQRSSDVKEAIGERAAFFFVGAIGCGILSFVFIKYAGDGFFVPLGRVFGFFALALLGYGIYVVTRVRKVDSFYIECPICTESNELASEPKDTDVRCVACNHMIPLTNGVVLAVEQVRCGFCNSLNYFSSKTEVLLCEACNREIPITQEDGRPTKVLPKGFAVVDDNQMYELVLMSGGKNTEDLVKTLQHMLALNRNQVKEMLEGTPVTLLQGITRMKADMLTAQLSSHGAQAEARVFVQN